MFNGVCTTQGFIMSATCFRQPTPLSRCSLYTWKYDMCTYMNTEYKKAAYSRPIMKMKIKVLN